MGATITLDEPLTEKAFRLARRLGLSLDQLCAEAIKEYVRSRNEDARYQGVTETLDRVYANEPSELDPGLAGLQAKALDHGEW